MQTARDCSRAVLLGAARIAFLQQIAAKVAGDNDWLRLTGDDQRES